jgi:hypothetical protein
MRVDHAQHVDGQVVGLQQMTKPQDRRLVGQAAHPITQARELSVQRHVVQRLFHGWVAQTEPLLKVVNSQHGFDGKRRATGLGPRCMRQDDLHQCVPRHDSIHLVEKLALARLLRRQVQTQAKLVGRRHAFGNHGFRSCKEWACFADLP